MGALYHPAELTIADGTTEIKWLQTNRHGGEYTLYGYSERPTQQIKIFDVPGMLQKQGFINEGATFNSVHNRSHIECMSRYGGDRMYWMADPVKWISIAYSDDWFKQPRGCWFP